ncbi:hypothetical protein ACFV0T_24885 [Streptomyces sp. NPDC059582]
MSTTMNWRHSFSSLLCEQLEAPVHEAAVADLNEVGSDTSLTRQAHEAVG